ncbi:MAG: abortive infection family protein, partial [Gammaproteobacteria bacterium]|nr:abortive infection family protein [Gammaproteobacteria bacterium]
MRFDQDLDPIGSDNKTKGRFIVAAATAITRVMDESDWKKFALAHGLEHRIVHHDRFLRSLRWGDSDHDGLVLDLVRDLYHDDEEAFLELFDKCGVDSWLSKHEPDLVDWWNSTADPLVTAIAKGLEEVEAVRNVIDLRKYSTRVQDALPHDPHQAIGATKDLLEAAMKTILDSRGGGEVDQLDFPALTTRCFAELGITSTSQPSNDGERIVRKITSSAKRMLEAANELRNRAGTGHGRVIGKQAEIETADATLVASIGLV